jgi:hypothetical protein
MLLGCAWLGSEHAHNTRTHSSHTARIQITHQHSTPLTIAHQDIESLRQHWQSYIYIDLNHTSELAIIRQKHW